MDDAAFEVVTPPAISTRLLGHQGQESHVLPENLRTGLELVRLPALDGFRAIAAFLVVFYHMGYEKVPGGLGVLIFFALSGFLITWLLLKENEATGGISLRHFYARRSLRIFPAFYAYWLLYVGLAVSFHRRVIWSQAIAALFYVSNYLQAIHRTPSTPLSDTWSLAVEEQFYLLWAPLFFLLRKSIRRQVWVLLGLIVLICIHRELLQFVFGVWEGYIYMAFDTRADQLLVGCLLAVVLKAGYFERFWQVICSHPALSVITASLLSVSVALQIHFGPAYRDSVAFVVDPVLVAMLIVQAIAFRDTLPWRFLQVRWVRYLGRISYSIYIYQQIVLYSVSKRLASLPASIRPVLTVLVLILFASASYFLIEKPFLGLKRRFRDVPGAPA